MSFMRQTEIIDEARRRFDAKQGRPPMCPNCTLYGPMTWIDVWKAWLCRACGWSPDGSAHFQHLTPRT